MHSFINPLPVFNLGCVFASLTLNILFWPKIKLLWSDTDAKKVTSYISSSNAASNNKSKFLKKVRLLAWNKRTELVSFNFRLRAYD